MLHHLSEMGNSNNMAELVAPKLNYTGGLLLKFTETAKAANLAQGSLVSERRLSPISFSLKLYTRRK